MLIMLFSVVQPPYEIYVGEDKHESKNFEYIRCVTLVWFYVPQKDNDNSHNVFFGVSVT